MTKRFPLHSPDPATPSIGMQGFIQVPAGQTRTVLEDEELIISEGARVDGELVVRGTLRILRAARPRLYWPFVLTSAFSGTTVFNNSSVPVDSRDGPVVVILPNRGQPGETVKVHNISDGTNPITVLGGGYPIDGAESYAPMTTPYERAEFERLFNQSWKAIA